MGQWAELTGGSAGVAAMRSGGAAQLTGGGAPSTVLQHMMLPILLLAQNGARQGQS